MVCLVSSFLWGPVQNSEWKSGFLYRKDMAQPVPSSVFVFGDNVLQFGLFAVCTSQIHFVPPVLRPSHRRVNIASCCTNVMQIPALPDEDLKTAF